jgi:hypothetical protein
MPIPTYTPGYPPDGSSLGQTKAVIRNNLDGTFQTLGIDHVNNNGQPGTQPAGYHTTIHQVSQAAAITVTGYNQVFAGVPGTLIVNGTTTPAIPAGGDTQLYALSSLGKLSQLTGYNAATAGFCWSGGILFQWGTTPPSSVNLPVNFPITYPNNIFNVQVTAIRASGGSFTTNFSVTGQTTAGFTIVNANSSATSLAYFWLAIGN